MITFSYRPAPYSKRPPLEAVAQNGDLCKAFQPVKLLSLESFLLVEPQLHQDFTHAHRLLPHRYRTYTDITYQAQQKLTST